MTDFRWRTDGFTPRSASRIRGHDQEAAIRIGRRRRALHVIQSAGLGGSESVFATLTERLHAMGWTVVCAVGEHGWLVRRLRDKGMPVVLVKGLGKSRLPEARSVLALRRLITQWDVALVHSMSFPGHLYAGTAARLTGRPCIVNVRNGHYDTAGCRRRLLWQRLIAPMAAAIVAPSQSICVHLNSLLGDRPIVCIPNGIAVGSCWNGLPREGLRARLGIPEDAFVIGTVGNIRPVKGHIYLLHAAVILAQRLPGVRFLFIGEDRGPMAERLREFCLRTGIAERVTFLGVSRNVAEILPAMDVFCLPSLSEGMPNSLLEAMAMALPVVASDVGGNREVVLDGETGYLVRPEEPAQLAEALLSLAQDAHRCRQMGEAGRALVLAQFNCDKMVDSYQGLYDSLMRGAETSALQSTSGWQSSGDKDSTDVM